MPAAESTATASDRGAATVWTAFAVVALVFLGTFLFSFGAAVAARHRAESAADLAALAAAGQTGRGPDAACARARWVADNMSAALTSCRLVSQDALVEVRTGVPGVFGRFGGTGAHARAGPVRRPP